MNKKKIIKFLSEIQMLKRVRREGVKLAGVKIPDSIAEHIAISTQIAYLLAKLESADASKCLLMSLFHDNEEVRIGDPHKISVRYFNVKRAEKKAMEEHFNNLPKPIREEILKLQEEMRKRNTKEAIIVKDADWLEIAIQAKIYSELGYKGCENWIKNVEKALETKSAKAILAEIRKNPDFLNYWWKGLKKMTYKKLKKK